MRKIILYIFLFISTLSYSIPAKRVKKSIIVDGQNVEVTLVGNEKVHYWRSADGHKYVENKDGKYAIFAETVYREALKSEKYELNKAESYAHNTTSFAKSMAKRKVKYQGERRGLLILVNFADNKFTSTANPNEDYTKLASSENYKGSSNYGSVRDYFKAQSYGQFDFVLDVVGPVTLSHNLNYYGANDAYGNDLRPGTMVWEACQAVDEEVDFTQYDWDGDGVVEQIFVLYAGYGEAQGGRSNTVWPHSWSLVEAKNYEEGITSCEFDGVTVDSYACSSELSGGSGKKPDGIGTICHEFSHCFGLPDFYCSDYSHNDLTMDSWSLMDYGCYLNDGYAPSSYTAYERWYCGWLEPTELSSPQFVKEMGNIDANGDAYIIYNDANQNEYYLLQNVQQEGWNSYAPGHGLLVLHVDYDANAWYMNTPNNNRNHLRMTPICADNKHNTTTLYGDTYPGITNNTELTDASTPAATLYNANTDGKKFMHKPLTDIAEEEGLVSFTFMGGIRMEVPENLSATISDNMITASWEDEQLDVESYNIMYGSINNETTHEDLVINEDFAKVTTFGADSNSDISSSLDQYLSTPGFTGRKLFKGGKGLKMGTSTVNGELITPVMTEKSGNITITVSSELYKELAGTLTIMVYEEGNEMTPVYISNPIETGISKTVDVNNVPEKYKVVISANKRCYLTKLQISGSVSNPYANKTIIDNVTTMPFSFTPAFEAEQYWMQIQAVGSEGRTSEWSKMIIVENGATKINTITSTPLHGNTYNLNGQRVGNGYKGIVLKNGKKILSK